MCATRVLAGGSSAGGFSPGYLLCARECERCSDHNTNQDRHRSHKGISLSRLLMAASFHKDVLTEGTNDRDRQRTGKVASGIPFPWFSSCFFGCYLLSSASPDCGGLPRLCAWHFLSPQPTHTDPPTLFHLHTESAHTSASTCHTQLPAQHLHLNVHHVQITNHSPFSTRSTLLVGAYLSVWYPVTQTGSLEVPCHLTLVTHSFNHQVLSTLPPK